MSSDSAYVWVKVGQRCDSILIKKDNLNRNIKILPLLSDYLKDSENLHYKDICTYYQYRQLKN